MTHPFTVGIHIDGAGAHPAAWRETPGGVDQLLGPGAVRESIGRAETAGFAFATLGGSHLAPADPGLPGRLDPVQSAAFAGPLTSRIGLIPQVPATYLEPFHTATQLASLDYVATGRGGVLISAENSPEAARQFGREALSAEELAAEVHDVVSAIRLLWDSWEDDAVIRDLPTGRYIDRDKLHYVDFSGRSFSVKGPAITPRPPQGQLPVIVPERHAAAVDADAVLVPVDAALEPRSSRPRRSDDALVIADLEVVLDSRGETAADRLAHLDGLSPWAAGETHRFVGGGGDLVAAIRELSGSVDGVRIIPATLTRDLDELRFAVLPELLAAGVITAPGSHRTLREVLGLPLAQNRFAPAGRN